MKERLYIATFSEFALENIKNNSLNIEFNHICISENLNPNKYEQTLSEMRDDLLFSGKRKTIIHGPFTELSPDSIDPLAIELTKMRYEQTYAMARELDVNRVVFHSGYMPWLYHESWHIEKSVEFWKKYMNDKPENYNIMIENVFEDNPEIMKKILEKIDDKRVSTCLDVGHANVNKKEGSNIEDWLNILSPFITHVHLHNNYGMKDQHLKIQEGTLDMENLLKKLEKENKEKVTYTIESIDSVNSIKWLKEKHFI